MQIRTFALGLLALAVAASCGEAGDPLDSTGPDAAPPALAVQALDCTVSLDAEAMRCDAPAPSTGGAAGAILGGQHNFVVLSSSNMRKVGDTLQIEVTVRNLLDQAMGTTDGETLAGGGVRVFFEKEPVSHPGGLPGGVANPSGLGWFTDGVQPYFEYRQVLRPDSVTPPLPWRLMYTPGTQNVTFRVYVQAPLQFENSRNGAVAADSARANGVRLLLAGGGGQSGAPGATLPQPVRVRVVDGDDQPVAGAILNFLAGGGTASPRQTRTDAEGYASAQWTLGPAAGEQTLRVSGVGGTLVVTATATGGQVLRLSPDSLLLQAGASATLTATLLDGVGVTVPPSSLAWTTSSAGVATVSAGVVTGVAPGRATITASGAGLSASAVVIVSAAPQPPRAVRLRIDPASLSLAPGATARVRAIAEDGDGNVVTGLPVRWASLDSTVARIDSGGVVLGVRVGSTRIRATVEGLTAEAAVTVSAPASSGGTLIGGIVILDGPYPVQPGSRLHIQFWTVQDPDGVVAVSLTARAPDGIQTAPCSLTKQDGGIDTNSLWSCDLQIPANAQHGTWTLDPVSARDRLGNVTTITGAEMLARRYPPDIQFFVENLAYDTVAPTLTGLSLSLETAPGGHYLVARFTATDAAVGIYPGSGIYRTGIEISSPGAALSRIMPCMADVAVAAPTSATWMCRVIALAGETGDEIVVTGIAISDRANNLSSYSTAQLNALGLPSRIAVP